jgi:hypothetical protein
MIVGSNPTTDANTLQCITRILKLLTKYLEVINMTKQDELKKLLRVFVYKPDGRIDSWRILEGNYEGDCDDFALTLLYKLSGDSLFKFWFNLITLRATFWFCKSPSGSGHLLLKYDGLFSDNTMDHWYSYEDSPHTKMFPLPFPIVALKMLLAKLFT